MSTREECDKYIPHFEKMIQSCLTAENLDKHNGNLFLPIQKGCYPQVHHRMKEYGFTGMNPNQSNWNCECVTVAMTMSNTFFISPNNFDAAGCAKISGVGMGTR